MKKALVVPVVLMVCASFGFARGASEPSPASEVTPVTLRWAHTLQTTHPIHEAAVAIANEIAERTNNSIRIDIYPAGQLGNAQDIIQAASRGSIDIIYEAASNLGNFYPRIGVFEMPFVFSSYEEFEKVFRSDFGDELRADFERRMNLHVVDVANLGIRNITSNRPIRNLSDFNGFKIRVPEVQAPLRAFSALGASPTPIAFSELYFSLQTNVVDGQENPITTIHSQKFFEVQRYITLSRHQLSVILFLVNDRVWNQLTADQQRIFADAATRHFSAYNTRIAQNEQRLLDEMVSQGMTVIELEPQMLAQIRQRVATVYPDFERDWGAGTMDRIQQVLATQ